MAPRQPGSYALIMRLHQGLALEVGQLGRFYFPPGWYAYAGSARGPGGLAARLSRHLRPVKAAHWHVDHLRAQSEVTAVWYTKGCRKQECIWALALSELPDACVLAPGFGASDCRCETHLLYYPKPPNRSMFARSVGDRVWEDLFHG
ncbi:MAG: GIY-YIG nuclease family protein [Anaerolineae bacterium]|jgi:Uri superfamily endonuclease